jgi:hypothetical protein
MGMAPLAERVHVHGHAPEVPHVMEEPVADLLRDRVRLGDGQLRQYADAELGPQAVSDPANPHVRNLLNVRYVPGCVRDGLHGVRVDAIEDVHKDGAARWRACSFRIAPRIGDVAGPKPPANRP